MAVSQHIRLHGFSQYFGYGPTSTLFLTLNAIKSLINNDLDITLHQNDGIDIFHKCYPHLADRLINNNNVEEADIVYSAFDPQGIFEAWLLDIPSIYHCNLFWFWTPSSNLSISEAKNTLLEFKERGDHDGARRMFSTLMQRDPHLAILLGYSLASHCIIRSFPNFKQRIRSLGLDSMRYTEHNVLMPKANLTPVDSRAGKNLIFFQLSGTINPIVSHDECLTYLQLVFDLASKLASESTEFDFVLCVNPQLYEHVKHLDGHVDNFKIIPSVSQRENLSYLKRASAVFTSPGLETIFESFYCNAPVFLLPEQNAGQYYNYYLLEQSGYNPVRFLIDEMYQDRNRLSGEEDIHPILDIVKTMQAQKDEGFNGLYARSKQFLQDMLHGEEAYSYIQHQHETLERHFGKPVVESVESFARKITKVMSGLIVAERVEESVAI